MGVDTVFALLLGAVALAILAFDFFSNGMLVSYTLKVYRERRYGKLYTKIQQEILDQVSYGPQHPLDLQLSNRLFLTNADDYSRALKDLINTGRVVLVPHEQTKTLYITLPLE